MKALPTLAYHGKVLTPEPSNLPLASVHQTLRHGQPVFAVLEPGDGTRYDLLVHNIPGYCFLAVVLRKGRDVPEGRYLTYTWREEELDDMARQDPWTRQVLHWWLQCAMAWKDDWRSHRV